MKRKNFRASSFYLLQIILFISISHAFIHMILASLSSTVHISVIFFQKMLLGTLFLFYWSQFAQRREEFRMERAGRWIVPSFSQFQKLSLLEDLLSTHLWPKH